METRDVKPSVRTLGSAVFVALPLLFLSLDAQGTGPGLEWATYLGGSGREYVTGMARTASGEIVVIGNTDRTALSKWEPDNDRFSSRLGC